MFPNLQLLYISLILYSKLLILFIVATNCYTKEEEEEEKEEYIRN